MPFVGQAEITIDAKLRLSIPAKFRARMTAASLGDGWYCVPWAKSASLRLYPGPSFEQVIDQLGRSLLQGPDEDDLEIALFSAAELLDQDANGRVRLTQAHVDLVGLPNEVMVVGAGNRLEIHDRARWLAEFRARVERLPHLVATRSQPAPRPPAPTPPAPTPSAPTSSAPTDTPEPT